LHPLGQTAPQAVRAAANLTANGNFVVVQLEIPLECVFEAAELASSKGSRFLLDPAPPVELPDSLLRLVDILRANASEACVLTGIRVEDQAGARRAAEDLRHRGVRNVSIQAGDEGDLLVWNDGEHWLPHLPVKTVDRSGAGDAFTAGLAVALAEGRSPAEAADLPMRRWHSRQRGSAHSRRFLPGRSWNAFWRNTTGQRGGCFQCESAPEDRHDCRTEILVLPSLGSKVAANCQS
jgi:sugar/nucleoside kinase (ribokinase family)